jgi:hypothetical protein
MKKILLANFVEAIELMLDASEIFALAKQVMAAR